MWLQIMLLQKLPGEAQMRGISNAPGSKLMYPKYQIWYKLVDQYNIHPYK